MSFKNNTIIETRVLEVRELGGPGKRRWREILVEYPEISFGPGQFVMIRKDCGPTCWAYPYMLQRSTDRGFTVCAVENSSLYEAEAGTPLVVWGANGRAVRPGVDTVVLSQSATLFLAAPFLEAEPRCRQIVLCDPADRNFLESSPSILPVESVEEMARELELARPGAVVAALNVSVLLELAAAWNRPQNLPFDVFAATKISCGVGGCKSCYLHSRSIRLGIPVCCSGPYLPYERVDFEMDCRCFHTFE